jgi:hypothetical protein
VGQVRQVDVADERTFPCDELFVLEACDALTDVWH